MCYNNLRLEMKLLIILFVLCFIQRVTSEELIINQLNNKILFGYQGWFSTDKSSGWDSHWCVNNNPPSSDTITFDLWPYTNDYPLSSLSNNTNFTSKTNPNIKMPLYDSISVIETHFKWMSEYNINGIIIQRFICDLPYRYDHMNTLIINIIKYAEMYGKSFSLEYDISGADENIWSTQLLDDWNYLVNELKITSSSSYIIQNNKPVLSIFGIGFTDNNVLVSDAMLVLNSLSNYYIIGGVPTHWRTNDGDSRDGFSDVYASMNCISPWLVGRFNDNVSFDKMYKNVFIPDMELVQMRQQDYSPVVFPGFSWTNLMKADDLPDSPLNVIPRNGGKFWEHQVDTFINSKYSPLFLFGAMFDEYDEGTAMAKAASTISDIPVEGTFLYLSIDGVNLPNDYYLILAGNYTKTFNSMHKQGKI